MVEATAQGDGLTRNVIYAKWRTDKQPSEGYSAELVSIKTEEQFWDNHDGIPSHFPGCDTTLDYFEKVVREHPNREFLGTRENLGVDENGKPKFGNYIW